MKKIQLGGHKKGSEIKGYALVDDADYDWLNQWEWCIRGGYAAICKRNTMHRYILGAKKGEQCDHINNDKLDNRRVNLRICTHQENRWNVKKKITNISGFIGVWWHKRDRKWCTAINIRTDNKYKKIYLGNYDDKILAARAYDEAAKKYHKEFAYTNFS